MRTFVIAQVVASVLLLSACPGPTTSVIDAGEPEVVEFDGEATGNPPDFAGDLIDAGNKTPIDAGEATIDTRCCQLVFRISTGDEAADAVATLVGDVPPLADGLPLTRVDGGYTAGACFPMMASSFYFYRFESLSSDPESGGLNQGDGGYLVTTQRYSPLESNFAVGTERLNFIPAVTDCAMLDAGQGP